MRRLLALSLALFPALAAADAVDFSVRNKVLSGTADRPAIVVTANDSVDDVQIALTREDGKKWVHHTGRMSAGQTRQFQLEVPAGVEKKFHASMSVRSKTEGGNAEFDFTAEIVPPATLSIDKSKFDLANHTLELTINRITTKIEVEVLSDQGVNLGKTEVPFPNAGPNTPLKVEWRQAEGTPMKISLKVYDPDEFFTGVELYPWRIDIPHDEVNFPTGSFKIEKSEEPKLTKSLSLIQEAVAKYGRYAEVKLYVAGHTDTVGPKDSNRALSLNRARAICSYFRARGLRIPIYFEGFGEEALKVATPDETDEVQNRRAEYIVAIEPPTIRGEGPEAWKPLR